LAEVGDSDFDDVALWVEISLQTAKANGPEDAEFAKLAAGSGDKKSVALLLNFLGPDYPF
jgi:hypothetical protein